MFFLMSFFAERTEFQSLYKKRETYQTIGIFLSMIRRTVRRTGEDAKIQTNNKGCQEAKFPHLHFAMFASLAFTSFTSVAPRGRVSLLCNTNRLPKSMPEPSKDAAGRKIQRPSAARPPPSRRFSPALPSASSRRLSQHDSTVAFNNEPSADAYASSAARRSFGSIFFVFF